MIFDRNAIAYPRSATSIASSWDRPPRAGLPVTPDRP